MHSNDHYTASELNRLLDLVRQAQTMVVFTGAGMSTESGILDYRSPGGVWTKVEPPTLPDFLSGPEGRRRYWDYYREFFPVFQKAEPNQGHLALGRLRGGIAQNIDGLHQAGRRRSVVGQFENRAAGPIPGSTTP